MRIIPGISSEALVTSIYDYKQEGSSLALSTVKLTGVDYRSMRADVFRYLNAVKSSVISGKVSLIDGSAGLLTFTEVFDLIEKYGNIQSTSNPLYVSYPKRTTYQKTLRRRRQGNPSKNREDGSLSPPGG